MKLRSAHFAPVLVASAWSVMACSAGPTPESNALVPPATVTTSDMTLTGAMPPSTTAEPGPLPTAPAVSATPPTPMPTPTGSQTTDAPPMSSTTSATTTTADVTSEPTSEPTEPAPTSAVAFTTPSGTFQGELSVVIAAAEGLTVHYTTDGTLPTTASPTYSGPLTVTETTQVRAQAFDGEQAVDGPATGIYIARTFDTASDIPVIVMEGYAGGRPQKTVSFGGQGPQQPPPEDADPAAPEYYDVAFMVFEPQNGATSLAHAPTLVTRAGYKERGQSSANAEKSPYKVEFWDEFDNDRDIPVLGMPAESDWAMIGEYFDKSQIQNSFIYGLGAEMGLATVRLRFAELYINFDGGPLEESDYFGLYALTETIKNQKNRLNLEQLSPEDTAEAQVSGGYIFKFDQAALDSGEAEVICTGSEPLQRGQYNPEANCFNDLGIVDPEEPNDQQFNYISTYLQGLHDVLHQTPVGDYTQFIDVDSFIDFMIVTELSAHVDAYVRSSHFFKERDELVNAGPLWDFNLGMASTNANPEGWRFETQLTSRGNDDWFYQLGQDAAFMQRFAARWRELRAGIMSDAALTARVEAIAAPLTNAGQRDTERWPNSGLGGGFGGGGGGGMGGGGGAAPQEPAATPAWREQVDKLIAWIPTRTAWIDGALAEVP